MNKLKNRLIITIDVEPDCDVNWNRSNPLTFDSILKGIPLLLRPLWNKYKINPIYFVSPEVVMNKPCCKILKDEIKKGAIIGTHLHSEYIEPEIRLTDPAGKKSLDYPCYSDSKEIEFKKIENLTKLIQKNLQIIPIWYRAARFGADLDTMKSLKKLGYKYDSSVTPNINWSSQDGPDHSTAPSQPYWISKNNIHTATKKEESLGIIEVPITIKGKRWGVLGKLTPNNWYFFKWLRPTLSTCIEQKRIIKEKNPSETLVCMFHSMEILPNKSPYVRGKLSQKIFLNTLECILKHNKKNYERYSNIKSTEHYKKSILYYLIGKKSERLIFPLLESIKKKKILELGCGTGRFTKKLVTQNELTCIDINPHLFNINNVKIIKGNASELNSLLPKEKNFDLITSFFMSEYQTKSELNKTINEARNKITFNGGIIMTFITDGILGNLYIKGAKLLKGINKYQYSMKQIKEFASRNKLKITRNMSIQRFGFEFAKLIEFKKGN